MKRIITLILALCIFFSISIMANAAGISADEQKILDALKSDIQLKSSTYKLPAEYINQAENFLNANDLTADEVNQILAKINQAKEIAKDVNARKIADIPSSVKKEIITLASEAAKVVDLKLTVKSGNQIVITDSENVVVFEATVDTHTPIKQTDTDMMGFVVVSLMIASLAALVIIASLKFNVNRVKYVQD